MIARHETHLDKTDIWSALAAALPAAAISWRQDGRPTLRDGRHYARFLAYVDANTVRERLDAVVPGEWDLTLELLPPLPALDDRAEQACAFKARLQILGVIREDVGTGRDYKSAATDAFKRAAVRFGIGHELYAMDPNWVQVDGDGRYARPVEDPKAAHERRAERPTDRAMDFAVDAPLDLPADLPVERPVERAVERTNGDAAPSKRRNGSRTSLPIDTPVDFADEIEASPSAAATVAAADAQSPSCPKCGGRMWDNRLSKRNPKAPDFKCRDRSCEGVIWPPRDGKARPAQTPATVPEEPEEIAFDSSPLGDDDIPL